MRRIVLAVALASGLGVDAAWAWSATVDGPDVFGVTKVIATEGSGREGIVVQCDSKDQLHIATIFRKKEFEDIPEFPATLLIKVGEAEPFKLGATLRTWNDNYGGIVVSGRTPELVAVVKAISTAKSKINVGYEIGGEQFSATFGARGSTSAMQKAINGCKLTDIELPSD